MSEIVGVHGREILDSDGNPTVEAEVWLRSGVIGTASVPSSALAEYFGATAPGGRGARYGGKGALEAAESINELIEPELLGLDATDQAGIDNIVKRSGANPILCVSLAAARAAAADHELPLYAYIGGLGPYLIPMPLMNLAFGGGAEFMIVPHAAPTFAEALRMGTETYHALRGILSEGGFVPNFRTGSEAFEYLAKAISQAGFEPGVQISIAADGFHSDGMHDPANIVTVRFDQAATLSETLETISAAKMSGCGVALSNGPGGTEDTFIADLAAAVAAGWIKTGAPADAMGTLTCNRLLRIEEALGRMARYAGCRLNNLSKEANLK